MIIFQTVFLSLLLLLLELLAGNFLISAGLPMYGAVYMYAAYGKKYGITSALVCGMILDAVYFRKYLFTPLIFLVILLSVQFVVIRYFRRQLPEAPLAGGFCIGGSLFLGNWLSAKLYDGQYLLPDLLSMLIFQLASGAIIMFLLTVLLDALAVRCKMAKFGVTVSNSGKGRSSKQ